jgi:hypothetical protein
LCCKWLSRNIDAVVDHKRITLGHESQVRIHFCWTASSHPCINVFDTEVACRRTMERSLTDATVYGLAYLVTDVSVSIDNEFGVLRLRS